MTKPVTLAGRLLLRALAASCVLYALWCFLLGNAVTTSLIFYGRFPQ